MCRFPGFLTLAGVLFSVVLAAVIGAAPPTEAAPAREPARVASVASEVTALRLREANVFPGSRHAAARTRDTGSLAEGTAYTGGRGQGVAERDDAMPVSVVRAFAKADAPEVVGPPYLR